MDLNWLLHILISSPLFGILVIAFLDEKQSKKNIKYTSILNCAFTLFFATLLLFSEQLSTINQSYNDYFSLNQSSDLFAILSFSSIMILISAITVLIATIMLISENHNNIKLYVSTLLAIESTSITFFATTNFIVLFVCLELSLIFVFFLIFSDNNRYFIATKFFVSMAIGSTLLFAAILYTTSISGDYTFSTFNNTYLTEKQRIIIFSLLSAGFYIKSAISPLYFWLPDSHAMAPTSASIVLSGILLKFGVYGFIRILLPAFGDIIESITTPSSVVIIIGMLLCVYAVYIETNLKRIIAYFSIIHMNIIMLGILNGSNISICGSMFSCISHSLVSTGLFILAFCLKKYFQITEYNRAVNRAPKSILDLICLPLFLANISFPLTCNFIGELSIISGIAAKNILLVCGVLLCCILSFFITFRLYTNLFYGKIVNDSRTRIKISNSHVFLLLLTVSIIVYLGVFPNAIFSYLKDDLSHIFTVI